ncbi:MAG: response regulator [bacterium]|nr:response regulator [bacterium]
MSYNLLIVDDSAIVRKVFQKTLALTGLTVGEVFEAANGQEALDVLEKSWIDVIFLDINMPVMNGMEFMKHLRAKDEIKDIPVIVISTEGSKERKEELFNYNIRDYVRKPISAERLSEVISQILGGA